MLLFADAQRRAPHGLSDLGRLLGWGEADTAIAIRTAVIQDGRLYVQAGAGIVYDSDPAKEWEETMNKGRALFRAVAQAATGL